jgi:hypothetical protein
MKNEIEAPQSGRLNRNSSSQKVVQLTVPPIIFSVRFVCHIIKRRKSFEPNCLRSTFLWSAASIIRSFFLFKDSLESSWILIGNS